MNLLKSLFTSKKFIAAITGAVVAAGARYGLNLDPTDVALIISPFVSYVIGQGISDIGKDAAKVTVLAENSLAEAKKMIKDNSQP